MEIKTHYEGKTLTQHEVRGVIKKANLHAKYLEGESIKSNWANLWALPVDSETKIEKARGKKNREITLGKRQVIPVHIPAGNHDQG